MSKVINVCIGIQARSTSERLPNKVEMDINGRTMLERVIYNCQNSASFVNNDKRRTIRVSVALLIPEGDPIGQKYSHKVTVFEGPEHDVLTRYVEAARSLNVDYMVRVTADCPYCLLRKSPVIL